MSFIETILASSIVAGMISAMVSYIVSYRLKQLDFINEYYKELVKKRLRAYELLEYPLSELKQIMLDDKTGSKPYHAILSGDEERYLKFTYSIIEAFAHNLWIDDKTNDVLEKINQVHFAIESKIKDKKEDEIIKIGQQYYQNLTDLRFELENSVRVGLYNLHNIKKGLKIKRTNKKRVMTSDS